MLSQKEENVTKVPTDASREGERERRGLTMEIPRRILSKFRDVYRFQIFSQKRRLLHFDHYGVEGKAN